MKNRVVFLVALLLAAGWAATAGFAAEQRLGYLRANIDPGRAGVFVDGKYLGPAANFGVARTYALAPGKHELRLVDPRFEEYTAELNIRAGKVTSLWENLKSLPDPQPPFGTLRVISENKFDAVYLNGRFFGHTGEFNNPVQGLLIRPGEYEVRVVPEKGGALLAWIKVPVTPGETTTVYTK